MREKSFVAYDLRGWPSPLYEESVRVVSLEEWARNIQKREGTWGVEVTEMKDIRKIPKGTLAIFRGGERKKNRAALEERIAMLARPYPLDYVMAGLAAKKGIALEIRVSDIVQSSGYGRMKLLENLRGTVSLALKYRAPLVITTGARAPHEVKHPRVLVAFGKVLGLDDLQAKSCISTLPARILEGVR